MELTLFRQARSTSCTNNPMIDQTASAENPWPNTETKTVLVCRIPKKDDKPSANEFVDKDGRICRWVVTNQK